MGNLFRNLLKKTFRVSRATFIYLLSKIRHKLERQHITEEPISPEQRLGICLYRLAEVVTTIPLPRCLGLGYQLFAPSHKKYHKPLLTVYGKGLYRNICQNELKISKRKRSI
jgi:hypothetical protein